MNRILLTSKLWVVLSSLVAGMSAQTNLHGAEPEAQYARRPLSASTEGGLSISAILDIFEPNILDYRRSIPNLFCTEKAEIVRIAPRAEAGTNPLSGEPWHGIEVTQRRDATFRMRRLLPEGTVGVFEESRVVNSIDGKAPTQANISEPSLAIVYGVFSNGLNILSNEGRACYNFSVHSKKKNEIQVDFVDLPANERGAECAKTEKSSGRIFIDSESMRVRRVVTHVPHHQLVPGLFGSWDWEEDFAPVKLLGKEYWLPSNIRSRSASDDRQYAWKLEAHYTDYRLFHTETRVVP